MVTLREDLKNAIIHSKKHDGPGCISLMSWIHAGDAAAFRALLVDLLTETEDIKKVFQNLETERVKHCVQIAAALIQQGGEYLNPEYLANEANKITNRLLSSL